MQDAGREAPGREAAGREALAPAWAALSAAGGRAANEDRAGDGPSGAGHAWVVADGLGGHAAGALAAERAVAAMLAALAEARGAPPARLARAFEAARDAITAAVRERPAARGCRTTAVALVVEDGAAHWGHVGDSRLYHFRDGSVTQRTRDHSVPQALVDAGQLAPGAVRGHPDRSRLLRSLGADEPAQPTLASAPLALVPGDAFLLCSDGFWELVAEAEMARALAASVDPADWLRRMERDLRAAARGAYDNYTAIAVQLGPRDAASRRRRLRGLRARAAAWAARVRRRLHSAPSPAEP